MSWGRGPATSSHKSDATLHSLGENVIDGHLSVGVPLLHGLPVAATPSSGKALDDLLDPLRFVEEFTN